MNIDEYPYACTKEGGNQVVISVVPETEEVKKCYFLVINLLQQ